MGCDKSCAIQKLVALVIASDIHDSPLHDTPSTPDCFCT